MFKLSADHPNIPFEIDLSGVKGQDSEGNPVEVKPEDLDVKVTSTDITVIEVVNFDADADEQGRVRGEVEVGSPGVATVEATVEHEGELVGVGTASFVVVAGALKSVTGFSLRFTGVAEEAAPPPKGDVESGGIASTPTPVVDTGGGGDVSGQQQQPAGAGEPQSPAPSPGGESESGATAVPQSPAGSGFGGTAAAEPLTDTSTPAESVNTSGGTSSGFGTEPGGPSGNPESGGAGESAGEPRESPFTEAAGGEVSTRDVLTEREAAGGDTGASGSVAGASDTDTDTDTGGGRAPRDE